MSLYLWINIITMGTFFLSFDKKVAFYKRFPALLLGIIVTAILFIPWDSLFAKLNVWGFNKQYVLGPSLLHLPLEEWLFFVTVPFACTFIHYVQKAYFNNPIPIKFSYWFWKIIGSTLLITSLIFHHQYYTTVTFGLCGIAIWIVDQIDFKFLSDFILTYCIALIPFFIVNSILTGSFTDEPIVWYNSKHIFGLRLGTIPIEDSVYNLLLLLSCTFTTHFFSKKLK